ncbi:MAG: DEAD/DEAH box helicase, partial [Desulfobulbaceae bacterium]|nr:DEAD/DEAH box helicase [Desulfobulbaceae bacterium]
RLSRPELLMLSSLIGETQNTTPEMNQANAFTSLLDTDAWQDPKQLPDETPDHLRGYQKNGLAWLFSLYQFRMGGILADDMGLGKTHQALALLQAVQSERQEGSRFLVVCPATVVSHWVNKTHSFYPGMDFHVYHGAHRDLKEANKHSLIITTYGIIRRDVKLFSKLAFDIILLDEVQHLKNKKTAMYKAARLLNGKVTIGLTGTPLENSTNDLKAIFDLCLPGLLGTDATFHKQYSQPIEERNDQQQRDRLARLISPFLLRRAKPQVLTELPDVIEDIRTCELSDDQVALYREVVEHRGRALLSGIDANSDKKPAYMEVLAVISYLKQICDHPALLAGNDNRKNFRSGKWDLFVELLGECLASDMKVVVFSHYTKMLDIIEDHLDRNKIDYCSLRGSMPLKKREEMIYRFNAEPECKVFCASLMAGGVGVDLTAAQAVIHYDRWWNAAREDQATSRVHRMGQRHVVQTFKLITVGTLEEKIHQLIEQKRKLAQHLVQEDDDAIIKRLSRDELIELLQWDNHR